MKKLYRLIILSLGFLALAMFTTGCDEENPDINHTYEGYSILGTWDCSYNIVNGTETPLPSKNRLEIMFSKYGTWNATLEAGFSKGSYELNGSRITLTENGTDFYWDIQSIGDSRMIIRWQGESYDRILSKE